MAIRAGFSNQEAEDVVQDTVTSIAKKMPEFQYDPERCSFKGYPLLRALAAGEGEELRLL